MPEVHRCLTPPAAGLSTSKKEKLPRQPDKQHGRATTKGYSYYSTARNKKKGAYTMSANEMASKIRELKELKAMAEELAAEITAIEDSIKAEMTARNTEEMTVDVYKIRWTKVLSNRFDSSALKKAMPELHAQFTKQTESRRFSIA